MTKEMAERAVRKKRISFWSRIFKQDVQKQANFVELMGWAGLTTLLVLLIALRTVLVDITVPAGEAKLVKLGSGELIVEAVVLKQYLFSVKEGQQANLKFLTNQKEKIELLGEVIEADHRPGSTNLIVKIRPVLGGSIFSGMSFSDFKSIHVRIIIQKKNVIDLFFEKQDDTSGLEIFE